MSAPPVAGLLSQFEILTPQVGHLGAQLIDFRQEPRDQPVKSATAGATSRGEDNTPAMIAVL